nr:hypothetical protein [Tanacetum cinerariifolium]
MMTSDQFSRLERDNPHDHIRWFNKITSTIKYKDVPNSAIKLMLFPFSLAGAACRTTNLRNEISNFQQRFDESFHEAWDKYKDLLRACPQHGFTELHQLDTFYNALNPADQDSLNSTAGGNLLERRTQDVLTIIENKSKIAKLTHAVNQQTSVVATAMTAILKQFQATPPPASVKAVEEICVTFGGAHPYYQCLVAGGNTFPELRDNIQGYVAAAAVNYNQGSGSLPSNIVANSKGGLVLDGPFVPTPPLFINPEVDERVEETLTDKDLSEYTIKSPSYLGKTLWTARALIDVHGEEMILYDDFLEDLFSTNQPSGNLTFSSHPELTSSEVNDDIFDPEGVNVLPEKLLDIDSTKDLHPPLHFDIDSNLKEIEYLLHQYPIKDIDSSLKDSIDQSNLANLNDNLGEKIKESKLLIDELDLPCDFLLPSEYDSFLSEDFSRVDALSSNNNEDKVFNPCILIQEIPFEIITRVVQDKKLAISNAYLVLEDFDPPLYELPFFKEVPRSNMLLPFSSENKKKVFKPGIHTSEKVHFSLITELSHQGYKVFKINQIFKSLMKTFLFSCGKDNHILAVPCLHFYPLDQFKYGGIRSS